MEEAVTDTNNDTHGPHEQQPRHTEQRDDDGLGLTPKYQLETPILRSKGDMGDSDRRRNEGEMCPLLSDSFADDDVEGGKTGSLRNKLVSPSRPS
ncbi:hypothetical protein CPC08DRAFT_717109 [Agrocybe pediades]|nr:hypothetical protein CPC08DRAFT_717109 [Agrocybe pediades]